MFSALIRISSLFSVPILCFCKKKKGAKQLSDLRFPKKLNIKIYRIIIFTLVLFGYETWSLTLREERRVRVFENRVLRIFEPKRDEVTGGWRKFHNEELHDLYSPPTTVWVIKLRRMRWPGHVAQKGRGKSCTLFWWETLREGDHWGDPGVDGRIILRWIFRKWDDGVCTGLCWLRILTGGRHL
jgi:hypothetical protein